MADLTLIDRKTFLESCEAANCEPYFNYQPSGGIDETCIGIQCPDWNDVIFFFIEITERDPSLASGLASELRSDSLGRNMIFYFPGFDLEDEDGEDAADEIKDGDMFAPSDGSDPSEEEPDDTYGEDPLGGAI